MPAVEQQVGVHDALAVLRQNRLHRFLRPEGASVKVDRVDRLAVADGEMRRDPVRRTLVFVAIHSTRSLAFGASPVIGARFRNWWKNESPGQLGLPWRFETSPP